MVFPNRSTMVDMPSIAAAVQIQIRLRPFLFAQARASAHPTGFTHLNANSRIHAPHTLTDIHTFQATPETTHTHRETYSHTYTYTHTPTYIYKHPPTQTHTDIRTHALTDTHTFRAKPETTNTYARRHTSGSRPCCPSRLFRGASDHTAQVTFEILRCQA